MTTPLATPVRSAFGWVDEELAELGSVGLLRRRRTINPLPGGRCEIEGRQLVNFASNDYLGLACDSRLREAAARVIDEQGVGSGASALVTGRTEWHERLERRIADFEGEETALLFPTGYAANVGTIPALVGRGDAIFSDEYNHASLIDGCRLSRAEVCVYSHADVNQLARLMSERQDARRRLIVTDGVFSMDGNVAPLQALVELAEQHDAMLLVDEAHGTGVLGEHGRGACESAGVESSRVMRIGTLSKAVGVLGGFAVGSRVMMDLLWNRARTQVFSTSLPPSLCAAGCAALDIIRDEPERRKTLSALTRQTRAALQEIGVRIDTDNDVPIVPVVVGDPEQTMRLSSLLETDGHLTAAIRPPTVPVGTSRLRISLSAAHSTQDIDSLVQSLVPLYASTPVSLKESSGA